MITFRAKWFSLPIYTERTYCYVQPALVPVFSVCMCECSSEKLCRSKKLCRYEMSIFFSFLNSKSVTESFTQFHGKLNLSQAGHTRWRGALFRLLRLLSQLQFMCQVKISHYIWFHELELLTPRLGNHWFKHLVSGLFH